MSLEIAFVCCLLICCWSSAIVCFSLNCPWLVIAIVERRKIKQTTRLLFSFQQFSPEVSKWCSDCLSICLLFSTFEINVDVFMLVTPGAPLNFDFFFSAIGLRIGKFPEDISHFLVPLRLRLLKFENFSSLTAVHHLRACLVHLPALSALSVSNPNIDHLFIGLAHAFLLRASSLRWLHLHNNNLGDNVLLFFASVLPQLSLLEILDVSDNIWRNVLCSSIGIILPFSSSERLCSSVFTVIYFALLYSFRSLLSMRCFLPSMCSSCAFFFLFSCRVVLCVMLSLSGRVWEEEMTIRWNKTKQKTKRQHEIGSRNHQETTRKIY